MCFTSEVLLQQAGEELIDEFKYVFDAIKDSGDSIF